jgi:Tfp pilus assembly protein PilF
VHTQPGGISEKCQQVFWLFHGIEGELEANKVSLVSSHSPLPVLKETQTAMATPEKMAEWEKKFNDDYTALAALQTRYEGQGRIDDAIRCTKRQIAICPDEADAPYRLAQMYLKKGDRVHWREALDDFLKTEDLGLQHAKIRVEIATWLMADRKFAEAKAYAYSAAETGANWALESGADCAIALEDWAVAEDFMQRRADRYPGIAAFKWYCLCRRIGHKNAKLAEEPARAVIDGMTKKSPLMYLPNRIAFHRLANEKAAALDLSIMGFEKTKDPIMAIEAALLANELGKADVRDQYLKALQDRAKNPRLAMADSMAKRTEAGLLATQFAAYIAAGKGAQFSDELYQKNIKLAPEKGRPMLNLWAGHFLLVQGNRDQAVKYLRLTATSPHESLQRTLAGAMLADLKIEPGRTRDKE